jgi:hypothetical protein
MHRQGATDCVTKKALRMSLLSSEINNPEQWRRRAEEARDIAEQMKDMPSKDVMLRIAKDYERLAKRAEERAIRV